MGCGRGLFWELRPPSSTSDEVSLEVELVSAGSLGLSSGMREGALEWWLEGEPDFEDLFCIQYEGRGCVSE